MKNGNRIVQVPFGGDIIDAVKTETGEILVHPGKICDSLGIRWESQRAKLATSAWACTTVIGVQVQDGQSKQYRNVTMIPLKIVPMWLAGISVNKVKPGIRAKLLAYQLEVVEVLSAWFLGVSNIPGLADEMKRVKERLLEMEERSELMRRCLVDARMKLDAIMGTAPCHEFLSLREFVDTYNIRGLLGTKLRGAQLQVISRQLTRLSKALNADVRKVGHPAFGTVNSYRFDILQGWLAVTNLANVTQIEDFNKLLQGRLFL